MRRSITNVLVAFAAAGLLATSAMAQATKPATQPTAQNPALIGESAQDAALPQDNHDLRVALRHITIARDVIKETKDGGKDRVQAKTKLNLAMDQLQKATGVTNTISRDDEKDKPKHTGSALDNESAKDAALPQENHELHVAVRHLTIARDVLAASKNGGDNRTEALDKVNDAMGEINGVLAKADKKAGGDKPSAKTE